MDDDSRGATTGTGAPVLIDLDLLRDDTRTGADAVPDRLVTGSRLRLGALVLGVALLLTAGGSAAPGPPPLTELTTLTVAPDRGYLLTPDRLFVETGRPGEFVSAYEPGRGRLLWTSENDRDAGVGGLGEQVGNLLLVRELGDDVPYTTAVDARTGAVRWSVAGPVEALADGRTGVIREEVFPADARPVDLRSQPATGTVYYSLGSGETWLVPPIGVRLHAVDLDTGRPLWDSVPVADMVGVRRSAVVPDAEGDDPLVVATMDGRVEWWDPRTGRTQRSVPAVVPHRPAMVVVGNLLVVQRADTAELTAYDVDTAARRWHRDLGREGVRVGDCGDQLCVGDETGWQLLDPVTGADAPRIAPGIVREVNGDHLVEVRVDQIKLVRTVDRATGRTLADLTGWEAMSRARPGVPILLTHEVGAAGPTWFGLLAPGATEVDLLGVVPYRATDCQLAGDLIACRERSDVLRLWRYRH